MTKTKTTSLQALTEALTLHNWEHTVEPGEVTVKDPTVDVAPRWSQRRVFGTKQVPGVIVRFDNGVKPTDRNDYSSHVSGVAKFTEAGWLVEISGGYPLNAGATLSQALRIVAEKSRFEVERLRAVRAEQREQSAAEAIAKADNVVAEKQAEATAAAEPALQAVMEITGLEEHVARSVLDALVNESGQPIQAYAARLWEVNQAHERAAYARREYERMEQNGWVW